MKTKQRKNIILAVLFCSVMVGLYGCSSSALVNEWHDPSFRSRPMSRMLIIAVTKDPAKRRIWEDAFVNELIKHDVAANPSYRLFPDKIPDTAQVLASVRKHGFDGILVTRGLPTETETRYVPGYVVPGEGLQYVHFKGRYYTYYIEFERPGFIETQKIARHSIEVWKAGEDDRIIWSAVSKTPIPSPSENVQQDVASLTTSELAEKDIIEPEK